MRKEHAPELGRGVEKCDRVLQTGFYAAEQHHPAVQVSDLQILARWTGQSRLEEEKDETGSFVSLDRSRGVRSAGLSDGAPAR
jgi:hypothetical protein